MRRLRAAFATTIAGCLVLATAASAAPPWSPPVDLSARASGVDDVSLALNGSGGAVALWTQYAGMSASVTSAARAPGGPFGPAELTVGPSAFAPDVAIAPSGEAVAVWSQTDGRNNRVWTAIRPAGGSFGPPALLSAAGVSAGSGSVAMAASGEAVAVWLRGGVVQAAIRPPGGAFGGVADLSGSGAGDLDLAVAATGEAVAAWSRFDAISSREFVAAAVRLPGAGFGGGVDLSAPDAFAPAVAMDAAGNGAVLWTRAGVVEARTHPAGRTFAIGTDEVSTPGVAADENVEAAADASGTVTAVWTGSAARQVQAAVSAPGRAFGSPQTISGGGAFLPRVAVNPAGTAVAAWGETLPRGAVVRAATRTTGGQFGATTDVSAVGVNVLGVDVAIDAEGSALAGWGSFDGRDWTAQTSYLDAAGPQLSGVSVPASGTAGTPVQVSASAFDVWSPLSLAWTFGDGGSAAGTSASHVYAAPGTYTVTVTATDAAGRATSATRQISVAAGATPPPPPGLPPVLSGLKVTPAAFRAAASGPSAAGAAATRGRARGRARGRGRAGPSSGTRVSFTLSQSATVRFAVERQSAGRRVGGRCVRATRANRRASACRRFVPISGGFERAATAGRSTFAFSGRLNGRKLAAGSYRLLATPRSNGAAGETRSAAFRVLPPPARRRARR